MNENMQQAMADIIHASLSAVETAKSFLSEQIPDVIQQLLLWHMTKNLILFLIGMTILIAIIVCTFIAIKKIKSSAMDAMDKNGWTGVTILAAVIACFVPPFFLNLTWLQIWIAPKIFLIEYAARMFK